MKYDQIIRHGCDSCNPEWIMEMREMEGDYEAKPECQLDGSAATSTKPYASGRQVGGDHYKGLAIQPSEYILRNNIGWLEGNAIKYLTRWKDKGGRTDLEKAKHYVELLLEWTK